MRLPDVDYSAFVYGPDDERHGLPRPTRRYAVSGDPLHARTEYWFGGLEGVGAGQCTLTARSPGIWAARAPRRVTTDFPIVGKFTVHELMVEPLRRVLADIERAGLAAQIDVSNTRSVGGTYCCRLVRGGSTPSPHAWGIAIDINPNHHLRGGKDVLDASSTNYKEGPPPSLTAIAPFFTRMGFAWGGHWVKPRDPMHFELTPLALLIMAGEWARLPEAFVERCRGGWVAESGTSTAADGYPSAGSKVKVVAQFGDEWVVLGEGTFDGQVTQVPVRFLERVTAWAAARTTGSYRIEVVDRLRDQSKVYLAVRAMPRSWGVGES